MRRVGSAAPTRRAGSRPRAPSRALARLLIEVRTHGSFMSHTTDTGGAPARPNEGSIHDWLRATLGELLGVPPAEVDFGVRFRELGLASLQVTTLVAQLSAHLGRAL